MGMRSYLCSLFCRIVSIHGLKSRGLLVHGLQALHPLGKRRVGVVEGDVGRVGVEVGQVLLRQALQGLRQEAGRADKSQHVAVRIPLVLSRDGGADGREEEGRRFQNDGRKQKPCVGQGPRKPEGLIEQRPAS